MANGRPGQSIRQSRGSLGRAEVGRQANDRDRILKSGGLLHFVMKEKAEEPFVHEVLRIEGVDLNRGQELLRGLMDWPVAKPAIRGTRS